MEKKNWKKILLTNLIVFLIFAVICVLSFITADNQMEDWIEDNNRDVVNFAYQFGTKGYVPEDKAEDTSEEVSAADTKDETVTSDSTLDKPQVSSSSSISPDSKYIAEAYGTNNNVTAGGLYPSEEIRIRDLATDTILWRMMGFYTSNFIWTPDSRYVSVSYTARIYGETVIVDTKDFTEVKVPLPEEIQKNMKEDRPDSYLYAQEWLEDYQLKLNFSYVGKKDDLLYKGTFIYTPVTGEITNFVSSEGE